WAGEVVMKRSVGRGSSEFDRRARRSGVADDAVADGPGGQLPEAGLEAQRLKTRGQDSTRCWPRHLALPALACPWPMRIGASGGRDVPTENTPAVRSNGCGRDHRLLPHLPVAQARA